MTRSDTMTQDGTTVVLLGSIALVIFLIVGIGSGVVSAANETEVSLSPGDRTVEPGESVTYDIVVENTDGGVGAHSTTVALDDPAVAEIIDVELLGDPGQQDVTFADDNSSVAIDAALMDTEDTGSVTIARVTVSGNNSGSTALNLDVAALGDEKGISYTVSNTNDAILGTSGADLQVSDMTVEPNADTGETPITATATVKNLGGPGSDKVELLIDGETVETQTVELGTEESTEIAFEYTLSEPGEYDVAIGDAAPATVLLYDPPIASLTANETTIGTTIDVELDATETTADAGVATYKWDLNGDGDFGQTTSDPTLTTAFDSAGEYPVTVTVVDNNGATDSNSVTVDVDTTPPTIKLTDLPETPISAQAPLTFSMKLEDANPHSGEIRIYRKSDSKTVYNTDITEAFANSLSVNWDATSADGSPTSSGTYIVELTASDGANNSELAKNQIQVDNVPPSVSVNTLSHASSSVTGSSESRVYTNGSVVVSGTADGTNSPLTELNIEANATFTNFQSTTTTVTPETEWEQLVDLSRIPDDGSYELDVTAVDAAQNTKTITPTAVVVLDREPPSLATTISREDASTARVDIGTTEPLQDDTLEVIVQYPDGTQQPVSVTATDTGYTGTLPLASDGSEYTVTATGRDRAGNYASSKATATIRDVNTTNNTVTVRSAETGSFIQFNTTQDVENSFVTITESDTPLNPLNADLVGASFLNGQLGAQLSSNLSEATIGIPAAKSNLPKGTSPEDVTLRRYNSSESTWVTVDTSVQTITLPDGTTDEYWVATVPHFSTYGAIVDDTTPPMLESKAPVNTLSDEKTNATITFEYADDGTGVNASAIDLYFDGEKVTTGNQTTITSSYATYTETDLTPGTTYTGTVQVLDAAGNAENYTTEFTAATDTQPPAIDMMSPTPGTQLPASTETVTVTAEYSDDASGIDTSAVTVKLGEKDITAAADVSQSGVEYTATGLESNTTYTVQVVVPDQAGNGPTSQSVTFSVNATAQSATGGSESSGGGGGGGQSSMRIDHSNRGDFHRVKITAPESLTDIPLEISDGARVDGMGVQKLDIRAMHKPEEIEMYVYQPTESPELDVAPLSEGTLISYFQVSLRWTDSKHIGSVRTHFTVPEDQLPDDAAASDVVLYQYQDGEWRALSTNHVQGSSYQARGDGVGQFAIGIQDAPEETTAQTTQSEASTTSEPTSEPTTTDKTTSTPEATTSTPDVTTSDSDDDGSGAGIPGFGIATALVALLAAALLAARRPT